MLPSACGQHFQDLGHSFSPEEGGQTSRDNFSPISTKLMADHEILLKARVVAIIFGFPSFVFNELRWNSSQWFDVMLFILEDSSF